MGGLEKIQLWIWELGTLAGVSGWEVNGDVKGSGFLECAVEFVVKFGFVRLAV
jgi:hypothetical protein